MSPGPRSAATPWQRLKSFARAHANGLLALTALLMLLIGKLDLKIFTAINERAADLVASVSAWPTAPLAALRRGAESLGSFLALVEENQRLREENRRLVHWQNEAVRLAVQNAALREALKIPEVPAARRHTVARMVADPGSPFVQTRLIDAGRDRGVEKGMPVVDAYGLVGRVVEVGERSARVLLVTDFNSKIPVVVAGSRDQAILEGRNGPLAELKFLPMDPEVKVGDRVLTSGRGGLLPFGLPVGEIVRIEERRVFVRPFVDWDRLDWVSVLATEPVPAPNGQNPTVEAVPTPMRAAGLPFR